jgi:hypothetical protein
VHPLVACRLSIEWADETTLYENEGSSTTWEGFSAAISSATVEPTGSLLQPVRPPNVAPAELAGQASLDFPARRLGHGPGHDQHDLMHRQFVLGDGLANGCRDLVEVDPVAMGSFDFLDDDDPFLAAQVGDREGSAEARAQARIHPLHRVFEVLRVVIDAAHDDEILDAASDIELALRIEATEIAGAQPKAPGSPMISAANVSCDAAWFCQ